MSQETKRHCTPCEQGGSAMLLQDVQKRLTSLQGWQYDEAKRCIYKRYEFKGFMRTMSFVNAIAWMASREGHHPDLHVSFNYCVVHYQTHAVSGITDNDFICAELIEALL